MSTADIIKTGTFTKYQLADQMRNYMHIDDKFLEGLKIYNMTHMTGKTFRDRMSDGQLYSGLDSFPFSVIYHNCTPYNAKRAVEVRCSFRAAKEQYNLEPIVLVEIVIPFNRAVINCPCTKANRSVCDYCAGFGIQDKKVR